ncbi:hypothetical protein J2S53_001576 [Actinopolyspora lacussalsi]|nr:hypothetical protein [Actinopolyspora lacussalsi]
MTTAGDVSRSATTFSVAELVSKAWEGEIRVPHFQRAFRWKREDAFKLFDSILKNYPIGSLLLWSRPAPPARQLQFGALHIDAAAADNALWVVDGQQRITTLANVVHSQSQSDPRFALAYHLENKRFVKPASGNSPLVIPLPVLFDPQQVMKWFWQYPEINEYFDEASAATQKIRQYSVPAYRVEHNDEQVLQDIFDRMNNYGKRLTKAEVFSALNAGDENTAQERLSFPVIAAHLDEERRFGQLDEDTVLQAVLVRRHPDTQREIRNEFSVADSEGRDAAYRAAEDSLMRAVAFLQDEVGVPHVALLPFRYLLIVLSRFFACHPEPAARNRKLLRRCYWRAAAIGPGIFPGGTTGATRILGQRINSEDETGSVQGMLNALGEKPVELPVPDVRKFRANSAASKIILCSWWENDIRDPESGEVFDRTELAESLTGQWTASDAVYTLIFPKQIPDEIRTSAANRILLPVLRHDRGEVQELLLRNINQLEEQQWRDIQRSHLITPELSGLWATGEITRFIEQRQQLLHETVADFLRRNCEWDYEDTPPLSELVIDGEDELSPSEPYIDTMREG